ncbi:hypothetical protein H7097_00245 [Aeromicrobium sp.]|nr:hypothetical protein [Candidatus Saccharibacteria bacterium]
MTIFDSTNAKHKLAIATLLLMLFAIPFAMQWHAVTNFDSEPTMAGGAVLGTASYSDEPSTAMTNNASQMTIAAGSSFTGELAL